MKVSRMENEGGGGGGNSGRKEGRKMPLPCMGIAQQELFFT